jgi:hypothetical protein
MLAPKYASPQITNAHKALQRRRYGKGEVPLGSDQPAGRLQLDIANCIRRSAGIATGAILLRDGEMLPTEQSPISFRKVPWEEDMYVLDGFICEKSG